MHPGREHRLHRDQEGSPTGTSLPKRRNGESRVDTVGISRDLSVPGARCHAVLNAAVSALFDACQPGNRHR